MIDRPVQQKLLETFRANLRNGVWSGFLPALNELAGEFAANPKTISKVIGILAEEGLVEARRGVGTVIRPVAAQVAPARQTATVCLPLYRTEFYSALGAALLHTARGYSGALRFFDYDADDPESGLLHALENGDRLVVFYPNLHMPATMRRAVRNFQERGRIVFIDTVPDKLSAPEVRTDHREAAAGAARRLAAAGWTPLFLSTKEGYVFRLRQLGFEEECVRQDADWPVRGINPTRELLARFADRLAQQKTRDKTALVVDTASSAGILRQLLSERLPAGRQIPVVTFDPPCWFSEMGILSVQQHLDRIAQEALELLFAREYRRAAICLPPDFSLLEKALG